MALTSHGVLFLGGLVRFVSPSIFGTVTFGIGHVLPDVFLKLAKGNAKYKLLEGALIKTLVENILRCISGTSSCGH